MSLSFEYLQRENWSIATNEDDGRNVIFTLSVTADEGQPAETAKPRDQLSHHVFRADHVFKNIRLKFIV